jgi:hypothetical protein
LKTAASTALLLAINKAVFDLKQMSDLSPRRAARAEILQQVLENVRANLMQT